MPIEAHPRDGNPPYVQSCLRAPNSKSLERPPRQQYLANQITSLMEQRQRTILSGPRGEVEIAKVLT
jgi:hypothetical protein